MFSKLFAKRTAPAAQEASLPDGQRIYAIGDIHGRLDLLEQLLEAIERDTQVRGGEAPLLIFLGDLIDRGPQSAQVIQRLMTLEAQRPAKCTRFLLGNHEEVFLTAVQGNVEALRFFVRIGGRETILSYGIDEASYAELDFRELLTALQHRVPDEHIAFLSAFEDMIISGDYAFVHAGVRPNEQLAKQRAKDLRWIREDFLSFTGLFEKMIVHGHSISTEVEWAPNRIGIDTGAYATGKLTALGMERDQRWILQTTEVAGR